ncbi:Peptidase family M48 [Ferrimonas sediminum]|uniref:Peptidase family M48 n=1 Tax=Ferrimonas sediminum TaxID=718193 RepID=A0A1G8PVZ5_9GAMM|nr:M48 family metallopeptidase [Ferrimonas sediminum]SDI96642.1 Peptidase family M48 [Ferrimonas sediminum]
MRKLGAVVLLGLLSSCATHQSPTGRDQMLLFSGSEMAQMGEKSFAAIKEKETRATDKATIAYVQCVADGIITALGDTPAEWEVVVFDSEQVNAFALPGKHIGVYTGLLEVAENQDQLAAVMGHEVAHVLARHSNERVSRSQLSNAGLQIADVFLQGTANRDLYMAGLGLGVQVGITLPYGRTQESEADVMGADLMARAGFDPLQSVALWHNMAEAGGGSAPPELMSTHPSHRTRISDLERLQGQVQPLYRQAKSAGIQPRCRR